MSRGKSRNRKARIDMMRSREANTRKLARQQASKRYDRRAYDKSQSEES
jgi:hypothetical protein